MRRPVLALLATALALAGCQTGGGTDPDPTPTVTPTDSPSPSPSPTDEPAAGLRDLGAPVDLGPGTVVGPTPDGEHLWVLAPEEGSELLGCEGVPFDVLWVVDPATGDRVRAIDVPEEDHPFVTDLLVRGAPDGRVALVGSCEGFLGAVQVGEVSPDGRIKGLGEVPMPPVELAPWTLSWVPGTTDFVATGWTDIDASGVYVIDSVTGDWIDIDDRPMTAWVPLADGIVAEVLTEDVNPNTTRARFVAADGSVLSEFPASEVVPSRDGFPALAFHYDYTTDPSTGTISLVLETGIREVLVDDAQGYAGSLSADGTVAAWAQTDPITFDDHIVLHEVATGRQVRLDDAWFGGVTFLSTGVAYVVEGPDNATSDFGDPHVRFRPWTA